MDTKIWHLYGHLSKEEIEFIESSFCQCEDGSYILGDKDILLETERKMSDEEKEKFKDLLDALKKGIKEEKGSLNVEIF